MWLPELGLWHYRARAYSPTLGRFMQTDPTGYADGINWYAYVGNDPVNRVDPTGTSGCSDLGQNTVLTGDQRGLGGQCLQSRNFGEVRNGQIQDSIFSRDAISTPEIDASAAVNMLAIQNDSGPNENIAQFDQDGTNVRFTILSSRTRVGNGAYFGRASLIGRPDAIGHSHPNNDGDSNVAPGFDPANSESPHDGQQARFGRPNYIVNSGIVSVLERSGGQFIVRIISGSPNN